MSKMQSSLEPVEPAVAAGPSTTRSSRRENGGGFGKRNTSGLLGSGKFSSDYSGGSRFTSSMTADIGELGSHGEILAGIDSPVLAAPTDMDTWDARCSKRDGMGREIKGTGLLIDRDMLKRDDDLGGHEVKPKSLVATSNLTIMHAPNPHALAIPAVPGTEEWKEARSHYLEEKEEILRAQHQEASIALSALQKTIEEHGGQPKARGPAALYAYVQQLQRLYTSINRMLAPLQTQRIPSRFMEDLVSPPENEDHSFDPEHIQPWFERADRVLKRTIDSLNQRVELISTLIEEVLTECAAEAEANKQESAENMETKWSTYLVRRADPKACSHMLDNVALCEDAIFGRKHYDFSIQRLPFGRGAAATDQADDRNMGTLSYSRMLIPDTWSLVRKAPLFRSSVDGSELMHEIASRLRPQLFQANSLVIKQGTIGMSMYFINSGSCKVAVGGKEIAARQGGDFFGELALTIVQERMADVYADGTTELFELSRSHFSEIIKRFPHVFERIRAVGTARVKTSKWENRLTESEKLKLLDDEHLQDSADLSEVKEAVSGHTLDMPETQELTTSHGEARWEESETELVPLGNQRILEIIRKLLNGDNIIDRDPELLSAVVTRLRRASAAPGVTVLRKGDHGEHIYIVESGTCRCMDDDKEITKFETGELVGVEALVLSGTHPCDFVSGPDGVRLLKLSGSDLMNLLQTYPVFYEHIRDVAAIQSAKRAQIQAAMES